MTRVPSPWGPRWSRWVGRFLARVVWRTEVRGRDNVPRDGAVIVIANHIGLPDGPVIHGVLPRPSHFLIKAAMMNGPLGLLLKPASQISVDGSGREALSKALGVLARGGVVGVFPEGHRGAGRAEDTYGGAAYLAVRSGATIVPTAVVGTRRPGEALSVWPGPGRRIVVAFGTPVQLDLPAEAKGKSRQDLAAARVTALLAAHVEATAATTDLPLPAAGSPDDEV